MTTVKTKTYDWTWNGEQWKKLLQMNTTEKMIAAVETIRNTVITSFAKGKTKGKRRPTKEGPLRVVTGRLMGSISTNWTGSGKESGETRGAGSDVKGVGNPGGSFPTIYGVVGTNLKYGRIHEFSGFAGKGLRAFIPARPYLRPAIDKNIPQIRKLFGELKILKGSERIH